MKFKDTIVKMRCVNIDFGLSINCKIILIISSFASGFLIPPFVGMLTEEPGKINKTKKILILFIFFLFLQFLLQDWNHGIQFST